MDRGLSQHFNKENPHHAYLLEGAEISLLPEVLSFLANLKVVIQNNPDVVKISLDTFKIEDARNLNSSAVLKGFSAGKKIFIISANSFLLEAQNAMLKLFEEPIEDTHFFILTPNIDSLLPTFVSRFYVVRNENRDMSLKDAEKFIAMPTTSRIEFLKELLAETDEGEEIISVESARSKSLKFLNSLEFVLHKNFTRDMPSDVRFFNQIFKVREFLRQPGSSAKTLMESIALVTPSTVPNQ